MLQRPGILPAGARQIPQSWFVRLDAYLKALTGHDSKDVRVNQGPGGTTYSIRTTETIQPDPPHPFQVIKGPIQDGEPTIGVIADSHVINGSDKDSNEEDNSDWGKPGLLTDDAPWDDPGWFIVPGIGEKIWLQFTFDPDGNLTSIDLQKGEVGPDNLWDEYPDPISINVDDPANPYQEFYNLLIAEVTDPEADPRPGFQLVYSEGTRLQVTQILKTNVMLVDATTTEDADEPNVPIMVAIPWSAPGTATDGSADEIAGEPGSDVKTPFVLGKVEPPHPFKLIGSLDNSGTGQIGICWGMIRGVSPSDEAGGAIKESDPLFKIPVEDPGIVIAVVASDRNSGEVVKFKFGTAADSAAIHALYENATGSYEDATGTYDSANDWILSYFVIGNFDIDEDGTPIPTNRVAWHINATREETALNGMVGYEWVHIYDYAPSPYRPEPTV